MQHIVHRSERVLYFFLELRLKFVQSFSKGKKKRGLNVVLKHILFEFVNCVTSFLGSVSKWS